MSRGIKKQERPLPKQCTMKSPLLCAAFFLNTLMSMMLTIAFTKISVPSEPTLLITNDLAMKFYLTKNDLDFHLSRLLWCQRESNQ